MKRETLFIILIIFSIAFCQLYLTHYCDAAFFDIGMGPRALGMGGAFTGLADDYLATYYNPAGLGQLLNREMGLSYAFLYLGLDYPTGRADMGDGFICYVHPFKREIGTFGMSYINRHASDLYSENSYVFSYGRKLTEKSYLGANFKVLQVNYSRSSWGYNPSYKWSEGLADPAFANGTSIAGIGLDIGVLFNINEKWRTGICLKDFNQPDIHLQHPDSTKVISNHISMAAKIGVGYEAGRYRIVSDLTSHNYDYYLDSGVEWWLPELPVTLRAGFGFGSRNYCQISTGASYAFLPGDGPLKYQIDYAFLYPLSGLRGTLGCHRAGFTIEFIPGMKIAASKLRFIPPAFQIRTGEISALITVVAEDTEGNIDKSFNETAVLSSSSGSGEFSITSKPWSAVNVIKFLAGKSSFYYRDTKAGNPVVEAVSYPCRISGRLTANIKLAAERLRFITPVFEARAGEISPLITVVAEDASGNIDRYFNEDAALSTSSGSGEFSAASEPWSSIKTVKFSEGKTSFYYRDTDGGKPVLEIMSSPSGLSQKFMPGIKPVAIRFNFLTPPFEIETGDTSPLIVVCAENKNGEVDKGFSGYAILSTSSDSGEFFILSQPWSPTDRIVFTEGVSSFYYRDRKSGSPVIKVSSAGMESASQQVRIKQKEIIIVETEKELIITALGDVFFAYNKADLTPIAKNLLDKIIEILKEYPKSKISIEGHTDSKGTKEYNYKLSGKRADAVAKYFIERGISLERISTMGYGEDLPVASNDTEEGRQRNRRVEIRVVK